MSQIKAAYQWVKKISISSIRFIESIQSLTIRQLKAIAAKMNKELGQVICKATFGKTMSMMKKQELIDSIWFVRSLQMASPKGDFELRQLTERIFSMLCDGVDHVYYFGFKKDGNGTAEQNCNRFQKHLATKGLCALSSVRKADRLKPYGFEWEVKVWEIKGETLLKLLDKDNPIAVSSVAVGDRFIVVDNPDGWAGSAGEVVADKGSYVFATMDDSPGKATFKKEQIKAEEEVTIEEWVRICQKMYDCNRGGKAENAMVEFAKRRGLVVVGGKVEVKF